MNKHTTTRRAIFALAGEVVTPCDRPQHTDALYVALARGTSWRGGLEGQKDKYEMCVIKRETQCVCVCARERERARARACVE